MKATVITASNRAAAGVYDDTTGPLIVDALSALGFEVTGPVVVRDGQPVGDAIRAAVDSGARAVLTTGGTGLTPTDLTPEVTRPLLDREVPGVAEASVNLSSEVASVQTEPGKSFATDGMVEAVRRGALIAVIAAVLESWGSISSASSQVIRSRTAAMNACT